jgi:preprotein translocase subunit SecF
LTGSGEITGISLRKRRRTGQRAAKPAARAAQASFIPATSDSDARQGLDRSGIKASIYGVIFVSLFMLVYYRIAGLAANVALITNIIILLGVMCSIGTTFTLPGIAGGVLTVGMAVDANVLIYERSARNWPRANPCAAPLTPATPARSARFSIRTSPRSFRPSF